MSYTTNKSYRAIPPHGGYRQLLSFQMATIVYDLTMEFVKKYIDSKSRTCDQMQQAARSGKQNIAEASSASGTSKKTELKLLSVARASQEELLQDYEDFLRQRRLALWAKNDSRVAQIRALSYTANKSYLTYKSYLENPEAAANCLASLIHQTNFLLDRQIQVVEKEFLEHGGFTERLYNARKTSP